MDTNRLLEKAQGLADVELAMLLSLVANQHCIIETEEESLEPLEQEIQLITSQLFSLTQATLHCSKSTSLEDFSNGIVIDVGESASLHDSSDDHLNQRAPSMRTSRYSRDSESQGIANVVILRNLNAASRTVQIQALELLRTNRIFTHTTVHNAPKLFLVVFLQSTSSDALVNHLSDHVFISHFHDPQDGFPNLEGESEWLGDDRASLSSSSVVRRSPSLNRKTARANRLGIEEIETLRTLKDKVTTSAEIKCYLQNVVTFLRLNRAVDGGVSARATQHFNLLTKCLAPLHGLDFVTPSLVALAARKVYPHRIRITDPKNERSMQYGSDLAAVTASLEGVTPETVIEDVLAAVEMPL